MKRLLKGAIQVSIPVLVVVAIWLATRPQVRPESLEGIYQTPQGDAFYELRGGRFQSFNQRTGVKPYPYLSGRYEVAGDRITVTYETITMAYDTTTHRTMDYRKWCELSAVAVGEGGFHEVLYYRTIGGVPILASEEGSQLLDAGRRVPLRRGEVFVFTTKPKYRGRSGWIGFLRKHRELAAALDYNGQPLDISWQAYLRTLIWEALRQEHPEVYGFLPDWVKI